MNDPATVTAEMVADHGLSPDEYDRILTILGRPPSFTELGIFSVMWSEHCSYKSSKRWLRLLPTSAPWVICGPGENAGVVDIGDGLAAIFKMESHNHPSYIEPYQGAATGVGGILRDVFTMGARPIANLNVLRFGSPDHPKTRHLVAGVVAGIGGYGNCVGVPTVGGECTFHPGYDGNILVNAMTVGLARADRIFYSAAAGIGAPVVYVGSKTGRDGIHGATMASAEFSDDTEEKRPTVQVGDPFTEKLLIEACLELMATDVIVAIQDMGAAGLTSSSFEMASKGGLGIELDLDRVPVREAGMTAYEMLLSESQERMLMVLKPGREGVAEAIFRKWELDFAVIGNTTDTGRMVARHQGRVVVDVPIDPLAKASPEYDRPLADPPGPAPLAATAVPASADPLEALPRLLGSPDLSAKRWVWEQYDHMVMADTVQRPGGDAAVVRVHGTGKGLAMTCDCTPRYCLADPVEGGRQAVAEAWRNLTAAGAKPLAVTDCLNFGSPERPAIMGQFAGCIRGMAEACSALAFPVVSGNVSFYNETNGVAIPPAPSIGGIGLIDDLDRMATPGFRAAGEAIVLIGGDPAPTGGWLGQSLFLREIAGLEAGAPPPVDLEGERRTGDFVRSLIAAGRVVTCHDISDGGLLVAVAEMALAGNIGAALTVPPSLAEPLAWLFGEDQGRYLVTVPQDSVAGLLAGAEAAGVTALAIGTTGGDRLTLGPDGAISLAFLREAHEAWLPRFMAISAARLA
ncbi:MAG: phosphoribosylformylglycinamidine synthase subunit PurL [Rhodospirillales bacterium]|nr:MAG: phosphoribosylformylglycinamidine synthase subunit PurL [Rhodospirillales bacterium]